jgi:hypothetical protein
VAGPVELAQPFCELRQEWVCGHGREFRSDQLPPTPSGTGVCDSESLVEVPLEDSPGSAELGWPGGSQVAGLDLGGGAPHLDVGDQLGRHWSMALGRPGWRFGCMVAADLVGQLRDQL